MGGTPPVIRDGVSLEGIGMGPCGPVRTVRGMGGGRSPPLDTRDRLLQGPPS